MPDTPLDYCLLTDVENNLDLQNPSSADQAIITAAITSASRIIDQVCGRQFWQNSTAEARIFVSEDLLTCEVDDFDPSQTIILQTDPAGDRTWAQTWTSADYQLEPINGMLNGEPWPCTKIRAIRSLFFPLWGGASIAVRNTQALVQVTAKFGWPSVPEAVTQAAIIQASAIWQGMKNPLGASAFGEAGIIRDRPELHPTAELLLSHYMEREVYVL